MKAVALFFCLLRLFLVAILELITWWLWLLRFLITLLLRVSNRMDPNPKE